MPHPYTWKVAHGSVTGTRHQASNQECQDFTCFLLMPKLAPDTIVAAVADGLGSAELGGHGAQLAAETAVTQASGLLWDDGDRPPKPERLESILNSSVLEARMTLEDNGKQLKTPLQSLSTTLLITIHTGGVIATAQVGDGACVISTEEGEYRTLAKPQRGEYANETTALTSRRALQQCQINIIRPKRPVRELALTTDGLLNLSLDMSNMEPHPPFFNNLSTWLRENNASEHPNLRLQKILASDLIARRTDDDVSLLLAVRTDVP